MVHAAHVGWFLIWSRPTVAKMCLFITMVTENPAVYLEAKPPRVSPFSSSSLNDAYGQ